MVFFLHCQTDVKLEYIMQTTEKTFQPTIKISIRITRYSVIFCLFPNSQHTEMKNKLSFTKSTSAMLS